MLEPERFTRECIDAMVRRLAPGADLEPDFDCGAPRRVEDDDTFWLTRPAHRTEGLASTACAFSSRVEGGHRMMTDGTAFRAERWIAPWVRAEMRERAIADRIDGDAEPPWSFRCDRVLRLLLENAYGLPLHVLNGPVNTAVGRQMALRGVDDPTRTGRMRAQRETLVLSDDLTFPNGLVYRMSSRPDTMTRPRIRVKADLPETLLLGCTGRDIGTVLRHSAFPGPIGVRIMEVRRETTHIDLFHEIVHDWLGTPPADADLSWRDIGARVEWRGDD